MSYAERAIVDLLPKTEYSQTNLLAVTNVPSSTFYSHQAPKVPTQYDLQDELIIEKLEEVVNAHEFNNSFGIKRLVQYLRDEFDLHVGEHRVHRLMKKINYKSVITQSYKSNRGRPIVLRDNLLKNIEISRPLQVLSTDVTYLVMPNKRRLYKATVVDWFTGDIVGSVVGFNITSDLTKRALKDAMNNISNELNDLPEPIILHSDNGSHFVSEDYEQLVESYGLVHSFSRPGNPEENTIIENYHSFFKMEFFNPRKQTWSVNQIIAGAARYDTWWNTIRLSTKTRPQSIPEVA